MSENDGFTSGGRKEGKFPNVYGDSQQVGDYATWSQEILEDRLNTYTEYVERTDISPRSRGEAQRILGHLGFELCWRAGMFDIEAEK